MINNLIIQLYMNILFITASPIELNNSSMIGNINLIKGIVSNGHRITVLCATSTSSYKMNETIKLKNVNIIRIGKRNILLKLNEESKKNKTVRGLILKSLAKLYRKVSILKSQGQVLKYYKDINLRNTYYDYVITSSDPKASHVLFKKIKNNINYGKWYQFWGDPLAEDITDSSIYPYIIKKAYENNILKLADKIIYVTPLTLELQKSVFSQLAYKMVFLPVPFGEEKLYKEKNNTNKITLSYIGGYHSNTRNIIPLYNAVKNNNNFELIIAGETDVDLKPLDNIIVYNHVNQEKVSEIEENSDILVCITNLSGSQIPAKPNYCAATNRSVLVILDGETETIKEYLSKYNRFEFCYNTEESIKTFLSDYKNRLFSDKSRMANPCNELSANNIVKKLFE